jgi:hypothetical protein
VVHARSQHPNAVMTPEGRRRMVSLVIDDGWTIEATAEQFQVDAKTVREWDRLPGRRPGPGSISARPDPVRGRLRRSNATGWLRFAGSGVGTTATMDRAGRATATCRPPSTTVPGWPTQKSSTMSRPSPPPGSRPSCTWFGHPPPAAGTVSVHAWRAGAIPARGGDENRPERARARPRRAAPVQPGATCGAKFARPTFGSPARWPPPGSPPTASLGNGS